MHLKKARFAALCGVSRPSIGDSVKRGSLKSIDGLIDISDPTNLAYILKHAPDKASEFQKTGTISGFDASQSNPDTTPKQTIAQPMAKKLAKIRAEETLETPDTFNPFAGLSPSGVKRRATGQQERNEIQGDEEYGAGLTDAEIAETLRKPLYDARKAKLAAEREAVNLDILHQSLGEREVFESFILELWQSMQRNYIDVAPKQAALVCKRLGMVGHELEVIEVLEGDIKKRQENVAHEVKSILEGRLTQKVIDDAEVVE